jgi:hypothetical protein
LVGYCRGLRPDEVKKLADRMLVLYHLDGDFSDAERARKRGVTMGPQRADGMSTLRGELTPEARATLEPIFAKLAAPGMCNPDSDEQPCVDGDPTEEQVRADHRTPAQRRHDALVAAGRTALCSGELGQLGGLPATIIATASLADLESGAGHALTAGGTLLPISDVVRLARHAFHYLALFDRATRVPLDLFRTRRTASPAQRIVLLANGGISRYVHGK